MPINKLSVESSIWHLKRDFSKGCVLTIGAFDGCHCGHRQLINDTVTLAGQYQVPAVVLTFATIPKKQFQPQAVQLMSLRSKCRQLFDWGVACVVCQRFNQRFQSLSAQEFIQQVLVGIFRIKALVVGDDFSFGRRRQGDVRLLKEWAKKLSFILHSLAAITIEGERVSSSSIRAALQQGDFRRIKKQLGRHYGVSGVVALGQQLGRKLGYPTANIALATYVDYVYGVYLVGVEYAGVHYWGVANLGQRPAVNPLKKPILEVHLLDFNGDLYGQVIIVNFFARLRNEYRFEHLEALKQAISEDVMVAKKLISTYQSTGTFADK